LEKAISHIFVELFVIFTTPPISLQSKIGAESYDQNTKTCAESKFESNPILTLIGEIPI
jgi:hypothetical protein